MLNRLIFISNSYFALNAFCHLLSCGVCSMLLLCQYHHHNHYFYDFRSFSFFFFPMNTMNVEKLFRLIPMANTINFPFNISQFRYLLQMSYLYLLRHRQANDDDDDDDEGMRVTLNSFSNLKQATTKYKRISKNSRELEFKSTFSHTQMRK